jgi:hypothetical protein
MTISRSSAQCLPPGIDPLTALVRAVATFRTADDEYRRAQERGEQPRLAEAGARYWSAKYRLFQVAAAVQAAWSAPARESRALS